MQIFQLNIFNTYQRSQIFCKKNNWNIFLLVLCHENIAVDIIEHNLQKINKISLR